MATSRPTYPFNFIIGLLIIYSLYLIWDLPQPYGKVSLLILILGLVLNLVKSYPLKITLFALVVIPSLVMLFMGTQFAYDNFQKRKRFNIETAVRFEKGNFETALKKAKDLNKPVFIDFYTAWCSPCLSFTRNVLTKEVVGNVMNEAFVNLKYDAERGEGIGLAKKYNIKSYPTLLILNENGEVLENIGGNIVADEQLIISTAKRYSK